MNYHQYAVEDFLLDKKFRDWAKNPDEDLNAFWQAFIENYPEKIVEVSKAKDMLLEMKFRKFTLNEEEVNYLWTGILEGNSEAASHEANDKVFSLHSDVSLIQERRGSKFLQRNYLTLAATISLVFLLTIALVWLSTKPGEEIYTTAYGETLTVPLMDGSLVTLNAHSSLRVPANWQEAQDREVWLEGEAYFQVKKISQNDNLKSQMPHKFVVHTQGVAVEVLGTQFNVNTRREKVQVVLNSGKVRLRWQEQEVMMKPGELVEVSQHGNELSQRIVRPETYSSWKNNQLLCDATPLYELAQVVEDRFGYTLVFQDEGLQAIKVSGTIPLDSIETFKMVMASLIKAKIELREDKLNISR